MKKRNLILLLVSVLMIVAAAAVFVIVKRDNSGVKEDTILTNIYLLDPVLKDLQPETRSIENGSQEEMVEAVLKELADGPKNSNLSGVFPENVEILGYNFTKGEYGKSILDLNLSAQYNEMDITHEPFCRISIVWSLTELPFIDGVRIFVEGQQLLKVDGSEIGVMAKNNTVSNPVIPPIKTNKQKIFLYFANDDASGLKVEERTIDVNQNQSLEYQIVEQLIIGPKIEGLYRTVPEETKIRNIKTEDRICYVDLSAEFIKHVNGSSGELLMIYSIVNSLTDIDNLKTVKTVQFTIEGKRISDYQGNLDLTKPFERDENIIDG